jgi:hypothetical protein
MITFNTLLEDSGLDPKTVRMARHLDTQSRAKVTPYSVWRTDEQAFAIYNRIQEPKKFSKAAFVASFVVTPAKETLFTNIFRNNGPGEVPLETYCPVSGENRYGTQSIFYDLIPTDHLAGYQGRLIVDWGPGERAWVQWADRKPKPIIEVRKQFEEPSFPGFEEFSVHLDALNAVPENWKAVLRSVQGIYLLVHLDTSQLYVGSAYGREGFWGRWQDYAANGHGGNVELKKLSSRNYQLSILKVCSSNSLLDEVVRSENNWKVRLCSRSLGLNAN